MRKRSSTLSLRRPFRFCIIRAMETLSRRRASCVPSSVWTQPKLRRSQRRLRLLERQAPLSHLSRARVLRRNAAILSIIFVRRSARAQHGVVPTFVLSQKGAVAQEALRHVACIFILW